MNRNLEVITNIFCTNNLQLVIKKVKNIRKNMINFRAIIFRFYTQISLLLIVDPIKKDYH